MFNRKIYPSPENVTQPLLVTFRKSDRTQEKIREGKERDRGKRCQGGGEGRE